MEGEPRHTRKMCATRNKIWLHVILLPRVMLQLVTAGSRSQAERVVEAWRTAT